MLMLMHVHAHTHTHTCTYTHTRIHTYTDTHTYTHTHTHMHTHTCVHTHMHTHSLTHSLTHTHTLTSYLQDFFMNVLKHIVPCTALLLNFTFFPVLFASDVKITYNSFKASMVATADSKTIFTMNPGTVIVVVCECEFSIV